MKGTLTDQILGVYKDSFMKQSPTIDEGCDNYQSNICRPSCNYINNMMLNTLKLNKTQVESVQPGNILYLNISGFSFNQCIGLSVV